MAGEDMNLDESFDDGTDETTTETEGGGDETQTSGGKSQGGQQQQAPGLDPKEFAQALAAAMREPENRGKSKEEVKEDLIDELMKGETVDVDKTYVQVLKHFQSTAKQQAAEIEQLRQQVAELGGKTSEISQSSREAQLVSEAGGRQNFEKAKAEAVKRTHEILGSDPADRNAVKDPSFARVANAQYHKVVAEFKGGSKQTQAPRGSTKPLVGSGAKPSGGNKHQEGMARMRNAEIIDD